MRLTILTACLLITAFLPFSAAADMKLTSSTQFLWYNDITSPDEDSVTEFAQYLRLNATKLNEANTIAVYGYGRATKDLSSSDDDTDIQGRLYYLYLDYRDMIKDTLDLRLGRHFVYIPSVSGIIDGATLDFKSIGPVGLRILGGRDIKFAGKRDEITGTNDSLVGASIYTNALRLTHVEVSYARRYDYGDVAREIAGMNVSVYLPKNISLYGDSKYDVLTRSTSELLIGLKLAPLDRLTLKGEYYQSFPQFDATSIYSVFAVTKYQEKLIKGEYALSDASKVFLGYAKEDFNEGEDADVYEAGFTTKPTSDLALNVSYDKRNGYGGRLSGWRLNGAYIMGKTTLSAGADFDDFRRDTFNDHTAKKYWAGAEYKFTQDTSLALRAEDNINVNYTHNYQGLVALNANF